jgi:predicted DNA binding CopG/RHH family protein
MSAKKKPLPSFKTDEEAEIFVATADLSDYDLTGGVPLHFEFRSKDANVSMRMPQSLLTEVKARAAEQGMPYQRYIRKTLEEAVAGPRKKAS